MLAALATDVPAVPCVDAVTTFVSGDVNEDALVRFFNVVAHCIGVVAILAALGDIAILAALGDVAGVDDCVLVDEFD